MKTFPSDFRSELYCGLLRSSPRATRMHYFETIQKLHKSQHLFGFQLAEGAPILFEAGGKLSTGFPPEGLVELTGNKNLVNELKNHPMEK